MYLDKEAYLSDPQTVTTGTDTGLVSEHTYDLGVAGQSIGTGKPLYVVGVVTTAFTSSGSNEPLQVNLLTDDDAALGSPTVLQELFVFPAVAAIGTKKIAQINPGHAFLRYLGVQYKTQGDGTVLTAGAVKVFITETPDAFLSYPDNQTIS